MNEGQEGVFNGSSRYCSPVPSLAPRLSAAPSFIPNPINKGRGMNPTIAILIPLDKSSLQGRLYLAFLADECL